MFVSALIWTLGLRREELLLTVVGVLMTRSRHEGLSLLLQVQLLLLLTDAPFLLLLFDLWWIWILWVQTGPPLLVTVSLLLLLTDKLLWELCSSRDTTEVTTVLMTYRTHSFCVQLNIRFVYCVF